MKLATRLLWSVARASTRLDHWADCVRRHRPTGLQDHRGSPDIPRPTPPGRRSQAHVWHKSAKRATPEPRLLALPDLYDGRTAENANAGSSDLQSARGSADWAERGVPGEAHVVARRGAYGQV
jgi:hypothetical protein